MITLTGFADEISQDLEEQLDVLDSEASVILSFEAYGGKTCCS